MIDGGDMQTTPIVGGLTLANILGAQIFGIPVERIASALLLTILGVFGRVAVEVYLSAKSKGHVEWSRAFLLLGTGLLSAATITIAVLALLKSLGVVSDDTTMLCLLFFGALGPDGLQWLMTLGASFIKSKTGVTPPTVTGITPPGNPNP